MFGSCMRAYLCLYLHVWLVHAQFVVGVCAVHLRVLLDDGLRRVLHLLVSVRMRTLLCGYNNNNNHMASQCP